MTRYKTEPWPPKPDHGMQAPSMPSGVKVTDTITGRSCVCDKHHRMYRNRQAAIFEIQMDSRSKGGKQ